MSRACLPQRPGRFRRGAAGLALALAVPLTMGVSCESPGGEDQQEEDQQEEDQQEQEDGDDDNGGGGEDDDR